MEELNEGKYIVIGGNDYTGKSTQVVLLRNRLENVGIESIEYHEPEDTELPITSEIRRILKDGTLGRDSMTDLLLFSAARHEIWSKRALPALKMGKYVVASRNYFSTLAYQGYGDGHDIDQILDMTRLVTDERYMKPDLAIILNLRDKKEKERRKSKRGPLEKPDTYESRDEGYQNRVNEGYLEIARKFGLSVISASQPIQHIESDIWTHVQRII